MSKKIQRVVVVGSRTLGEWDLVNAFCQTVAERFPDATFGSGGSRGVDSMAAYTLKTKLNREVRVFPANWDEMGPGAGYARNWQLAIWAEVICILWDGESKGTAHMMRIADRLGKKVVLWKVASDPEVVEQQKANSKK